MKVAVLGASPNKSRYSNMAIRDLLAYGHEVIPVHPTHKEIEGLTVIPTLGDIRDKIDTLTVYIGPQNIGPLIPGIISVKPTRVILNPGAESAVLKAELSKHHIDYLEACTLVMLRTKSF